MTDFHYSTETDLKERWGGLLEHPYISKIQRHLLDGFKVTGLRKILERVEFDSVLDVGCGLGEYKHINRKMYTGLDNSYPRVKFAHDQYSDCTFVQADAVKLPFKDHTYDAVLLANTAHHLSDKELIQTMDNLRRVTKKYIIIDDCVRSADQSKLSRIFYSLDRGTMFRTQEQFEELFVKLGHNRLVLKDTHRTFPGLYLHAVFVIDIS